MNLKSKCETCEKRETCTEPCEWLEGELKKVTKHRHWREVTSPHPTQEVDWTIRDIPSKHEDRTSEHHAQLRTLIIQMWLDGCSSREIACHLPCSDRYIRRVVGTTYVSKRAEKIRKIKS